MGRLIDAETFERSVMCSDAEDMQDVIYALRDYPTAYDPDKVVEQLEEVKKIMTSPVNKDCFGEECKAGLKEKYHERLLKEGRLSQSFEMPDSIIPEIYGTIEKKPDGTLYTTKAQRTGCSMCGFGIHMEKRPHRFDLLYESNQKEWDYLMFHMCKDKDGNDYGWAKVLDYIGVGWDPTTIGDNCKGQMSLPLDQMI